MKRGYIFIAVTAVIMALSVAGCAVPAANTSDGDIRVIDRVISDGSGGAEPTAAPTAEPVKMRRDMTIATVVKVTGLEWFERMTEGIAGFAEETGVNIIVTGPEENDAPQQVKIVEELIEQGVDAIAVVPISAEALEPVLKTAREAGIVVISHEGEGMVNVDWDIEAFDNAEYGAHLMEKLGELTGGTGEYAVCVGSGEAVSHNQWIDAAAAYQQENFPGMSMYGSRLESAEDQETAYEKVKELLKANPNIVAFQGSGMADVAGAALAVEEEALFGKVRLVGTSLVSVSGKFIREGTIDMISFWDPADAGYVMNRAALMVLEGDEIADGVNFGREGYESCAVEGNVIRGRAWIDVTRENVDDPAYDF